MPVVADVERMRRRLVGTMEAGALDAALRSLGPPAPYREDMFGDLLGRLRSRPDAGVRYELEHVVPACRDPSRLDPGTRRLLCALLDAIRSNVVRAELRQRIEAWGAAWAREALARMTQERGVRLTSKAWDAIEAADLDELAFLHGVPCVNATRGIQQGERAVLLRLLRQRFGHRVDADVEQRLATAFAQQIAIWIERVLSAATLAELLAD